ncbi:MAG: aspartate aminotransferase family protein [Longimicrobiales bacterium]
MAARQDRELTLSGAELPSIRTPFSGPASAALARRLAQVESRNVTCLADPGPIFWTEANGANIRDADDNVYIDLTAGFGVAAAGHANPRVASAIERQAAKLPHGLGDVHPPEIKVRLLERLAAIAPADLSVTILASTGAEAVEAALKTAFLRSGRPGILAFQGSYHGLTYGALATTWPAHFRSPFQPQLFTGVTFARFASETNVDRDRLDECARRLDESEKTATPIGAVLVEPIQGRGGIVLPSDGFLRGLRDLCDGSARVLVFDEVYTGFGRTGRWFACEHWDVVPDIMAVGKALSGSVPVSAAIGSRKIMDAWPSSTGEAIHTSTFLGNPIGCAAALAQLDEIESRGLLRRATEIGERVGARTTGWTARFACVLATRGIGALQGVVMTDGVALEVARVAMRQGVLVLAEGERLDVLAITPPLVITDRQLDFALDAIESALESLSS